MATGGGGGVPPASEKLPADKRRAVLDVKDVVGVVHAQGLQRLDDRFQVDVGQDWTSTPGKIGRQHLAICTSRCVPISLEHESGAQARMTGTPCEATFSFSEGRQPPGAERDLQGGGGSPSGTALHVG